MDRGRSESGLRSHGSGKASSRPGSGTLGSPEEQPMLSDRREVVVKVDGNGNGHAPFSFHGADAGGGGKAGNATSSTHSTATTTPAERTGGDGFGTEAA